MLCLTDPPGSRPPTHYYTLDAVPATARPAAGAPLQVVAVHIPPALDRQEMVRETAANQVDVNDQNRWSAPFDQMAQRVLTQDLAWSLLSAGAATPIASRHVHLQQATGADYTAQAQTMSRILGTIADQIAAAAAG